MLGAVFGAYRAVANADRCSVQVPIELVDLLLTVSPEEIVVRYGAPFDPQRVCSNEAAIEQARQPLLGTHLLRLNSRDAVWGRVPS